MVTEKLDTHVRGMYINESEVCKNEENVQINPSSVSDSSSQ